MKILRNGKAVEKVDPPAVDISSEAVAPSYLSPESIRSRIEFLRATDSHATARMLEALAADRDRLRTFVRCARGIVQEYANRHFRHTWAGAVIDPLGAHAWLAAEAAEIGTARDGGDPGTEKRT
jgi:hypothetical protein